MAEIFNKMDGNAGYSSKCREARRRRAAMHRAPAVKRESASDTAAAASNNPLINKSNTPSSSGSGFSSPPTPAPTSAPAPDFKLEVGYVAITGRARDMEDAVSVKPWFVRPFAGSPLNFAAVFDGHGGSHVSTLCKERMQALMGEELIILPVTGMLNEEGLIGAVKRSFERMDELALKSCACGYCGDPPCQCERSGLESQIVGSTAVVAVVGSGRVLVANCGDSRAVISRAGVALPMSFDHKPDRLDELARITASGGRVINVHGARVNGILAMSRALGDKFLKPIVISEPEIMIMERHPQDECLILASDGLWDVISNETACEIATQCLNDGNEGIELKGDEEEGGFISKQCELAAALLARLALARKSMDNISVVVIDLRRT